MAKTVTSSSAVTGEKMAPPSITLLPDKRSPTNCHSSPARTGKTTPSNTEKKPQINGHASPSHLAANHAAIEGYMKTDDRMRLAKERREEKERTLAAREQLMREKDRRARLHHERTVEERWRKLDEQRQREELRRAAVEEKRRQQLEEERERLEALIKRSFERSLLLEQRTKRWSRGWPSGAGDSENAPLPFSAASAFSHGIASPLPAVSESAPCSPHRSPFCSSLNPADHNRAGLLGGSQSTPNTPKKERLRRERRTASPGCGSPLRRPESPATSKLASKIRAQSPGNAHHHHNSPTRHRPNMSSDDKKAENKKVATHGERSKAETALKKNTDTKGSNPSLQAEKTVANTEITKTRSSKAETSDKRLRGDTPDRMQSPDRKDHVSPKVDSSEKKTQSNVQEGDKKKEAASCMGKGAAGTTNAEEATRLLAERRRQARAQKELDEKKREQEEEKRLQEQEKLRKQLEQEQRRQQEVKAQQAEEKKKNEEDVLRLKEKEKEANEKKEEQDKEHNDEMDREKEKVKVLAQEEAERQRLDRELQAQQEEEERQLRKKRIEEIMKRTRKGEADFKEEQVETKSVSGDKKTVQTNAQVKEQASQNVEFQVKEPVTLQVNSKECALVRKESSSAAAAQMDNQKSLPAKNNTHHVTPMHIVPEKRPDAKQTSEEHDRRSSKERKACDVKPQRREAGINANEQRVENAKATDQINKEPTKLRADAKASVKQGGLMNGALKGSGSALSSGRQIAEGSKQQSLRVSAAEGNHNRVSQVVAVRASVTPPLVRHLLPSIIKLEPLDVKGKGSCDEVQSMEVSPASKEELISIPVFSPVIEIQHSGLSNSRALEDLMDLTDGVPFPKLTSENNMGDCNKNLIEGVVSPMSDSKLIGMSPSSSNKLSIQ
ncbi:MAP7 domain-containing protein 2a isoform X2 [Platichthys flesus]|uniref:MAP7 domain-containing protein 2a isoform X2 n=1 Tax=Platichthys flesus TaxID=8260 RepID=UPI002DB74CA0|nr:MAP7 domain-containing protein 2a isoform X2 [Platichthys flesus]